MTDCIVNEVLTYTAAGDGREAALRVGTLLFEKRAFRIIPATLDLFYEAWSLFQRHAPSISFTDATSLAVAEAYGHAT